MRTLSPPWRRVLLGSWIVIAVLSVATLVLYVDNGRMRTCIANYMTADQQNTKARADIADSEREAFLIMLKTLTDPAKTAPRREEAVADYIALVEENNVLRKQNPVLPVPTDCG